MWSRSNPQCDDLLPLCQEPEVQERGSCPWCVPGMTAAGEGAWGAWWCRGVSAGHPEHRPLEGKGFSCCEQRLCLWELLATEQLSACSGSVLPVLCPSGDAVVGPSSYSCS